MNRYKFFNEEHKNILENLPKSKIKPPIIEKAMSYTWGPDGEHPSEATTPGVTFEIMGDRAMFATPHNSMSPTSYPFPTPSAIEGLVRSIYCKPQIQWVVRRIEILNPIEYFTEHTNSPVSLERNFSKAKNPDDVIRILKNNEEKKQNNEKSNNIQRTSFYLKNVHYRINVYPEKNPLADHSKNGGYNPAKHTSMLTRRIKQNNIFRPVFLGTSECPAIITLSDDKNAKPPINDNCSDYELMPLRNIYENKQILLNSPHFNKKDISLIKTRVLQQILFKPILNNGIISIPRNTNINHHIKL